MKGTLRKALFASVATATITSSALACGGDDTEAYNKNIRDEVVLMNKSKVGQVISEQNLGKFETASRARCFGAPLYPKFVFNPKTKDKICSSLSKIQPKSEIGEKALGKANKRMKCGLGN